MTNQGHPGHPVPYLHYRPVSVGPFLPYVIEYEGELECEHTVQSASAWYTGGCADSAMGMWCHEHGSQVCKRWRVLSHELGRYSADNDRWQSVTD